jgi:hypothetical protein
MSCFIVIPSHAEILASEGWTKKMLKEFLLKGSDSPIDDFLKGADAKKDAGSILSEPPGAVDPDSLMILVAGGPGAWTGLLKSVGGINNEFVTKKIQLPENWEYLVKKYRDIVPSYANY